MQLWEITLPTHRNDGASAAQNHFAYRAWLLEIFGGYTMRDVWGAWRNDHGQVFEETSTIYSVAMPNETGKDGLSLVEYAMHCFPDQEAFFVAKLGGAAIYDARPELRG